LGVATTVFDMVMAESGRDACIAAFGGGGGGLGGWAMAEGGAMAGAATGPAAVFLVPVLAVAGAAGGGYGFAELGKKVGDVLCPY
jgi:hypothetical protein